MPKISGGSCGTRAIQVWNEIDRVREEVECLGHLEDRLVCDDIAVQHLSMESYTVEYEGDSMLSGTEH
jgi:hypothetical protein